MTATYKGQKRTLVDLADEHDISFGALRSRLGLGWKLEDALTIPAGEGNPNLITVSQAKKDKKSKLKLTTFATCRYRCNAK